MSQETNTGFLQGLGISAGLISAPILITIGIIIAILLLCACCCLGSLTLGVIGEAIATPIRRG